MASAPDHLLRWPRRSVVAAVVLTGALLAGCGNGEPTGSSTIAPGREVSWPACTHTSGAYTVEHPPEWQANEAGVLPACTLFDLRSVEVQPATEIPFTIAVAMTIQPLPADGLAGAGPGNEVRDRRTEMIDGRRATRVELVATGDGLRPAGMRATEWAVPIGEERTLLARTHDVGTPAYTEKQAILDRMMATLEVDGAAAAPEPPDDLPDEGPDPVGEPSTEPVVAGGFPSADGDVALLTDVRLARRDGFDRVVLEFVGDEVPSYRVAYTDEPVHQAGSGQPVEVAGEAVLTIDLSPASGVDLRGESYEQTYTGPQRIGLEGNVVEEAVQAGDFEAFLNWAIGVERRAPFGVNVLHDPLRLVVDVVAAG